jgi:hypothetical protein
MTMCVPRMLFTDYNCFEYFIFTFQMRRHLAS